MDKVCKVCPFPAKQPGDREVSGEAVEKTQEGDGGASMEPWRTSVDPPLPIQEANSSRMRFTRVQRIPDFFRGLSTHPECCLVWWLIGEHYTGILELKVSSHATCQVLGGAFIFVLLPSSQGAQKARIVIIPILKVRKSRLRDGLDPTKMWESSQDVNP